MMGSKGPKISSVMMGESRGGSSITVGAMYLKSTTSSTTLVGFSGKSLPIMYHDELSILPNESQGQAGLTIFSHRVHHRTQFYLLCLDRPRGLTVVESGSYLQYETNPWKCLDLLQKTPRVCL